VKKEEDKRGIGKERTVKSSKVHYILSFYSASYKYVQYGYRNRLIMICMYSSVKILNF
jgi:hypothetical protein